MKRIQELAEKIENPFRFYVDYYKEDDSYLFGVYIGNAPMVKKFGRSLTDPEQIEMAESCINDFLIKFKAGVFNSMLK